MKNSENNICSVIESKMNEIIEAINEKHSMIEQDPLDSELRTLDRIFYILDKDQTSYEDLLDALRLSLKVYQIN
jgi:hypothetical protein